MIPRLRARSARAQETFSLHFYFSALPRQFFLNKEKKKSLVSRLTAGGGGAFGLGRLSNLNNL